MIPTTITGIVILLLLLLPGFVFVTARERHQPSRKLSALRETSVVIAATTVSYFVPVIVAIGLALAWPGLRSTFASLLSSPQEFGADHPFRLLALIAAFTLLASSVSYFVGSKRMARFIPRAGGSAWWMMFEEAKPATSDSIQVSATLSDGTIVTGSLHSWSREAADHQDRELVLGSPIWLQDSNTSEPYADDSHALSISAREIRFLSAKYFSQG
ncbi:MAG: DUF6338 family protein [Leucobacter sp.]